MSNRPRVRREPVIGVFSIDTALDPMTAHDDAVLRERKLLTARDSQLQLDEIDACHHLRDGVFHLDACIHFNEVVRAINVVVNKLNRSRISVAHFLAQSDRGHSQSLAELGGEPI